MKYKELSGDQKQAILEREIEDFRNSYAQAEALEFFIKYWLENSNEDFDMTDWESGQWQYS